MASLLQCRVKLVTQWWCQLQWWLGAPPRAEAASSRAASYLTCGEWPSRIVQHEG